MKINPVLAGTAIDEHYKRFAAHWFLLLLVGDMNNTRIQTRKQVEGVFFRISFGLY